MAKHRRDILWLSFAAVTGVVAAAIATKVGVEQISDRNHWDFDLKRWQNNLLKNGVDTSIIHPKACERMYKMGIYFDGDAFVLPDGDRMYVRKDNDVSVALMTLEISALDEQKVLIHSTERNKDDFLLRNDIRIIQSDGTRISGKHSAFATWQDRCLLSGTQVDVFNAQFANQWRRRGITNDAEGNIVMQSGQTIPLLGRNSDLRPPHRIECDHDFNTDTMSITFYEWNTASTTIEKRTAYIDARGSVQR